MKESRTNLPLFLREKKTKACVKFLVKWCCSKEEFNIIEVAKNLSSLMTHILIEAENSDIDEVETVLNKLEFFRISELFTNVINGNKSEVDAKNEFLRIVGDLSEEDILL